MVLQTIACWVDAVVYRCFFHHAIQQGRFDIDLVKNNIALRSLVLVYVLVKSYRDFLCYISDVDSIIGTMTPSICYYRSHIDVLAVIMFWTRPHFPGGIEREQNGTKRLSRYKASSKQQSKELGDF